MVNGQQKLRAKLSDLFRDNGLVTKFDWFYCDSIIHDLEALNETEAKVTIFKDRTSEHKELTLPLTTTVTNFI
ncbi:hypothetical protein M3914_003510 [Vibrio metschnikovii]|nr:hypothetical protein [Vibrio metschnikovii]